MAQVRLDTVIKRYATLTVVHGIGRDTAHGEFAALAAPLGCGELMTPRMIAGLEGVSDSTIRIGRRVVNTLPPSARNVSVAFQNYALYPCLRA